MRPMAHRFQPPRQGKQRRARLAPRAWLNVHAEQNTKKQGLEGPTSSQDAPREDGEDDERAEEERPGVFGGLIVEMTRGLKKRDLVSSAGSSWR